MYKAIALLFLLFSCGVCFSQIDRQYNAPRVGDNVDYFRVTYPSVSVKDNSVVWDLTQSTLGRKKYTSSYILNGDSHDTLSIIESGSKYLCFSGMDGFYECGFENSHTKIDYDIPIKLYAFPMSYGDSINGVFRGTGNYCDRQQILTYGSWTSNADATGSLILPSGDTLHNVVRIHLQRRILCRFYPMDNTRKLLPMVDMENIHNSLTDNDSLIISDSYFWFARGYRYPILKYQTAHAKTQSDNVERKVYFCPPEIQEELPLDDENIKVRTENSNKTNNPTNGTDKNKNFKYTFSNDSYGRNIHISYTADSPIDVNAILTNTAGVVYRTLSQTGNISGSIDFNYSSLQPGQYVVYIKTGTETYIEKFNNR